MNIASPKLPPIDDITLDGLSDSDDLSRDIRRLCAVAAALSAGLLIYASLIPLDYTPVSWGDSISRWREIPWLNLQLYQRADWVANAIVVLPVGFLAAAAVGWGRRQRWQVLLAAPIIAVFLMGIVVGIELVQVWFPTRTVSLNDICAGVAGALLGPALWILVGRFVEHAAMRFLILPHWEQRLQWLCIGYVAIILLYSVLPLDLVLSRQEWNAKVNSGRVLWNPLAVDITNVHFVKALILGALRMVPIGVLLALVGRNRLSAWGLFLIPIGLELIQLPVFTKHVSVLEIVGGWLGGITGFLLGAHRGILASRLQRPSLWGLAWGISIAGALVLLLMKHDSVITDAATIARRYENAWTLPLAKYYVGSEYSAYTSMLSKLALFGAIGVLSFGWIRHLPASSARMVFWMSTACVVVVAFAIESLQIFLPPLVPDFSDALTYILGFFGGYAIAKVLWEGVPLTQEQSSGPAPGA